MHLFPQADVPVVQVALPVGAGPAEVYALGAALRALRSQGVLVVGSGSMTHNLAEFFGGEREPAPYVLEFSRWMERPLARGDLNRLAQLPRTGPACPPCAPDRRPLSCPSSLRSVLPAGAVTPVHRLHQPRGDVQHAGDGRVCLGRPEAPVTGDMNHMSASPSPDGHKLLSLLHRPAASEEVQPWLLVLMHGVGSNEEDLFGLAEFVPAPFHVISLRAPLRAGAGQLRLVRVRASRPTARGASIASRKPPAARPSCARCRSLLGNWACP